MFHHIMTNGNNKLSLKESAMAASIHDDTGFCSGEDYMEHELHSPTDSSEDSVEVKVSTITLKHNKRKLVENNRKGPAIFSGPLKKRMCLKVKAESNDCATSLGKTPFRPWSPPCSNIPNPVPSVPPVISSGSSFAVPFPIKVESPNFSQVQPEISAFSYFRPPSPINIAQQTEPVSLVIKREKDKTLSTKTSDIRVPIHPQIIKLTPAETERMILKTNGQFPGLQPNPPCPSVPTSYSYSHSHNNNNNSSKSKKAEQKREQRNYKNMTRERRVEANARERTRVHTISAAFDTLRQAVPSYSHNQKLSKLSVLRIACSYIMTLSSIVNADESEPSTPECVDLVSRTIQREGKLRKKKDDND